MKIRGAYILTLRSIRRMIAVIAAAFAALCTSASASADLLLANRLSNATQSLLALKLSLPSAAARAVVPDLVYRECKALYMMGRPSGGAQAPVPTAAPPAAAGFTASDRKMLSQVYRAAVYGETPTDQQVAGDVRRRQVLYGAKLYRPSSRYVKGVSSYKAAGMAIRAPLFRDVEGAYSPTEVDALARAIQRVCQAPPSCDRS